eukprot:SAG31_NODE_301_length_18103_cov_13.772551_12_plen_188_part_00
MSSAQVLRPNEHNVCMYAANLTTGRWKPNANHALVEWTRKLLAEVEAVRTVHWVHVKGHSADGGNDRADALVQWGKGNGPYARLRNNGGEGDSRHGAATQREQIDWLKVLATDAISQTIFEKCGVLCLGRLRMTNSLIRKAVNNTERTRLIAQPCGGHQHEHYVFRTKLDRELAAEKEQRESRDQDE